MYKPTHAAQPDRRPLWEALILAALLALFLAIQLPKLDSVPWDQYESWRQSDTYSIAVNYVQYGMDLLHPQLNYDGVSENYAQLELQIVPYLSALVFQLTGTMTPVVPRLLCMLFFLGSAWFLYRLMRGISGRWPALVGLGIYLFLPLSMMTAHVIQPEACALFFYCGGVWLLWRFQQTRRLAFLWGASAMTAVAIMEKTPVAFVGLVFLYVLFSLGGLACLRSPVFYGLRAAHPGAAGGADPVYLPPLGVPLCGWHWPQAHFQQGDSLHLYRRGAAVFLGGAPLPLRLGRGDFGLCGAVFCRAA